MGRKALPIDGFGSHRGPRFDLRGYLFPIIPLAGHPLSPLCRAGVGSQAACFSVALLKKLADLKVKRWMGLAVLGESIVTGEPRIAAGPMHIEPCTLSQCREYQCVPITPPPLLPPPPGHRH